MKNILIWVTLLATTLFAACGGGEQPADGPNYPVDGEELSIKISNIIEDYTSLSVKIVHTGAEKYGYYVEQRSENGGPYTAADIFEKGTVANCNKSGSTTFNIKKLIDGTAYTLYVAAKSSAGELSDDVSTIDFATKNLPEFAVTSNSMDGFTASVRLQNIPATSVVKWAITDLASYNYYGGAGSEERYLARNEAIYANYFTSRYDFDVKESTRTFTKDGVTYAHYEPIQPGQPIVLLLAEYGAGTHAEWGNGYYSPLFGASNPSGYFRSETIVATKPEVLSAKPTIVADLRTSGKGSIIITPPAGVTKYSYLIVDADKYAELSALVNNSSLYLQWFVSSTLAKEVYGAVEAVGTATIDASKLNLTADKSYHCLVTAWGDEQGSKQSFTELSFTLPPSAPERADNTVIAHRGGSKEAGVPDNSIASLKYAMSLGCYASETDIYWTKDNRIVVAHADSNCKINGLYPWESTLAEIQAAGKLSNGETVPSLEDYLRAAMVKGSKTKVCLDVKAITKPSAHDTEAVKACQRACEIITEMEAQAWCEFICSGRENITKNCAQYANKAGIDIGAMGDFSASKYKGWGYTWHNRDKGYGITESEINTYLNAGMEVSVFTIDNDSQWSSVASYYTKLRGITTNYPQWMLKKF